MGHPIGVAVIGAGFIAEYHLAGLAANSGAAVRVLVGRSAERVGPLAQRFDVPEIATDWQAALSRPDVDAVVICTPDDTHEEMAIAAAQAGKAILLQKPMAGSVAACRRIVNAAKDYDVDLQVSFMHRWFPEFRQAQVWLAEGIIGRVHSVRLRNATPGPDWGDWFFSPSNVAGGVVDQLGVHGIDLLLQLFGPITGVSARLATLVPTRKLRDGRLVTVGNPDTAFATYDLAQGVLATHEMSQVEAKGCDRFRLELYGESGTMWLRTERGPLAVWAPHRFGETWHSPVMPDVPFGAQQHKDWLEGVADRSIRLSTASDAVRGMEVADAIRRSHAAQSARVAIEMEPQ